ncbi:hypothetical protein HK096_005911, partial [Nowakowskiella sp. JEL0078]
MDNFKGDDRVRVLACGHVFHEMCIDVWLLQCSTVCPNCRLDTRIALGIASEDNDLEDSLSRSGHIELELIEDDCSLNDSSKSSKLTNKYLVDSNTFMFGEILGNSCAFAEMADAQEHVHPNSKFTMQREHKVVVVFVLTLLYFFVEIVVGYLFSSLALVADSFHMLSDLLALVVGFFAFRMSRSRSHSHSLTYGLQRAEVLGALLNSVFLLALCFSLLIQVIQRFFQIEETRNPMIIVIVGSCGLLLNLFSMFLFYDEGGHAHSHGAHSHDHGSDNSLLNPKKSPHSHNDTENSEAHIHYSPSIRNRHNSVPDSTQLKEEEVKLENVDLDSNKKLLLPLSSPLTKSTDSISKTLPLPEESRFRIIEVANRIADPETHSHHSDNHQHHDDGDHGHNHANSHVNLNMRGMFLHVLGDALGSVGVIISALVAVPGGVSIERLEADILFLDDVDEVHELHVWQLSDNKMIGSVHIITLLAESTLDMSRTSNMKLIENIKSVFHAYGIHSTTVQLECVKQ